MAPRKPPPGVYVRSGVGGAKSYEIKWRDGGGRTGRLISHTYPRLAEAVDARAQIQANGWRCDCPRHAPQSAAGLPAPEVGGLTFGAFAERHVASLTGVGPGYRARFAAETARHFAPFLDVPLDDITELSVREWIRGMEDGTHPWLLRHDKATDTYVPRPISPVTIRRLLAQSGSVLGAAQAEGLATRNPFRGHRLGRRDRDQHTEMVALSHAEWGILEAALPEGVYRDLCAVLVGTGLRWGEVTALTVGAVEPLTTPPRLHVARAWQSDGKNGYQIGTPKSWRSRRTVPFSGAVLDALLPHLAGKRDDELVFTTPNGSPIRSSNFHSAVWKPSIARAQAAGLERRPRVHDLRHAHVSWLIAAGRPVPEISRRLGHESVTTTIDRYGHLLPQLEADTLAALDQAMPRRQRD